MLMKLMMSFRSFIQLKTATETLADLWIIQWRLTRNGHFQLSLYESIKKKLLEMSYRSEMTITCEHHPEVTVEAFRL